MDFIPYMELGHHMKNKDGSLKPTFNPVRDKVYAIHADMVGNFHNYWIQGMEPVEEKFISLKDDKRKVKEVVKEYFSKNLSHNDPRGNYVEINNEKNTSWEELVKIVRQVQNEAPDVTAAQALYLIDAKYKELGFISAATFRVPFANKMVKEKLKTEEIIVQARKYLDPLRQPMDRMKDIKAKELAVIDMMANYVKLQSSTFQRLILVMKNDQNTHKEKFWQEYNNEAIQREALGRQMIGVYENFSY